MEFLNYDFMQRALIVGLIIACICPMIGIFLIVRRQSLLGDGLGHLSFAGVTGGYLIGIYPPLAAVVVTVLGALGIEIVRKRHFHYADMTLAIFFYAGIALAIIFSSMTKMPNAGLLSFLFGSILTVSAIDLVLITVIGGMVAALIAYYFPLLMLTSLDEEISRIAGIHVDRINLLFCTLAALVVVLGMMIVGILLVSALMIVPVAAAHLLGKGFKQTLIWSIVFSLLAVLLGLYLSYFWNIAPGGTIVMLTILFYIFILVGKYVKQNFYFSQFRARRNGV